MTSTMVEKAQETSERVDGKTPNGGDYAIAYFLDAERNLVPKSKAFWIDIYEYNADGNAIYHTLMKRNVLGQ